MHVGGFGLSAAVQGLTLPFAPRVGAARLGLGAGCRLCIQLARAAVSPPVSG